MGGFDRDPKLTLCNAPLDVGLPGRFWPVVAALLGALLFTQPLLHVDIAAKRHSSRHPSLPPLPLWQSFRFIYVIKSKQSVLLWSCPGRFH